LQGTASGSVTSAWMDSAPPLAGASWEHLVERGQARHPVPELSDADHRRDQPRMERHARECGRQTPGPFATADDLALLISAPGAARGAPSIRRSKPPGPVLRVRFPGRDAV